METKETKKGKPLPAREMHKFVWGCVGVFTLVCVTYPIAMWRVTQMEKFRGIYVKSLTMEGKDPAKVADANVVAKVAEPAIASSPTPTALAVDSTKKLPEKSPDVAPVTNKSPETAIASSATDKTVQALPVLAGKQDVQAVEVTNQSAEITDRAKLDELARKVYDRINQTWQATPTFNQNLVYRVSASQDGAIANFEPINQPAKDFTKETPLPNMLKSSQIGSSEAAVPTAKFTVIFAPSGVLEVNP